MGKDYNSILNLLRSVCGNNNVITQNWRKYSYTNGWRFGKGNALAVVKPVNLTEIWNTLKVCVENNIIVINIFGIEMITTVHIAMTKRIWQSLIMKMQQMAA